MLAGFCEKMEAQELSIEYHRGLCQILSTCEARDVAGGEGVEGTYGTLRGGAIAQILALLEPLSSQRHDGYFFDAGSGVCR